MSDIQRPSEISRLVHESAARCFPGKVPVRTAGRILMGLGVFILPRQLILIAAAAGSWVDPPPDEVSIWIADFIVAFMALVCLFSFAFFVRGRK